ncbi:MAG: DUF3606 domain-containing protein [Xanthomonadales bacterium]|nr:DUF3606 domain-containing protein [Xanthomonadales bacterium]
MSDDLRNRGIQDDIRINVNQDWELRDWSQRLGITPQELRDAVRQVGPIARDVRAHLARPRSLLRY